MGLRQVVKRSLLQLLLVYSVLASLVYIGLLSQYTLHFQLFAVLIGIISLFSLGHSENRRLNSIAFLVIAILFVIFVRTVPYTSNSVPLGYDPGMYKYMFESYATGGHIDKWILEGHPPVLSLIMSFLLKIGLSSWMLLVPVFIAFCAFLCLLLYLCVKEYFGEESAVFASILFAVSYTQYMVFWYNYYKNILGLCFMLLALLYYKKKFANEDYGYALFVFFGALLAGTHLPTFLIFILCIALHSFLRLIFLGDYVTFIRDSLLGVILSALGSLFYIGHLKESVLPGLMGVVSTSIGAGTFISLDTFMLYSLAYLPFAFIGIAYCIKYREWNPLIAWFFVCMPIVIFKLIFYNRYIIQLDLSIIILAGVGAYWLYTIRSTLGLIAVLLLIISSGYFVVQESYKSYPLVSENEMNLIEMLHLYVPANGTILSTHKYYSPWLLGYSQRRVVAPGLFSDEMNLSDYTKFVYDDTSTITSMLSKYPHPLYIYFGINTDMNISRFRHNDCYKEIIPARLFEFKC